jgi:hypothetical protein
MLSSVQLARQAPAAQVDGEQEMATPSSHVPSPSQRPAGVKELVPSQALGLQMVPAGQRLQPPWPLQIPICPQLASGSDMQMPCRSRPPAGVGTQAPAWRGSSQDTQAPVQATLQQTPSAQKPESHWAASSQGAPTCRSTPHAPLTHTWVAQSLGQKQASPVCFEREPGPAHASLLPLVCPEGGTPPSGSLPIATVLKADVSQADARHANATSKKRFQPGPGRRPRFLVTFASSRIGWGRDDRRAHADCPGGHRW